MVPEPKETAQALLGCSPPSDLPAKESRPDEPGLAHLLGLGENLFVFQISEAKLGAPRESLFSVGRAGTCDKQARQWPSRELWAQGCDLGGCCLGFAVAEPPHPFTSVLERIQDQAVAQHRRAHLLSNGCLCSCTKDALQLTPA